jgi:hypothetical protein
VTWRQYTGNADDLPEVFESVIVYQSCRDLFPAYRKKSATERMWVPFNVIDGYVETKITIGDWWTYYPNIPNIMSHERCIDTGKSAKKNNGKALCRGCSALKSLVNAIDEKNLASMRMESANENRDEYDLQEYCEIVREYQLACDREWKARKMVREMDDCVE